MRKKSNNQLQLNASADEKWNEIVIHELGHGL